MTAQEFFLQWYPWIVTTASAVSVALPSPKRGSVGYAIKTLVNVLAMNVGHAKPDATPKAGRGTVLKLLPLLFVAALLTPPAEADTLTWDAPTHRVNGEALAPGDITGYKIYRASDIVPDGMIALLPGDVTEYDVSSCKEAGFYAVTALASQLESPLSATVEVRIDAVGCRPKSPTVSVTL